MAAPADRAVIEIAGVSKRYDGRAVVDALSLAVAEGEFCALIGASGCGKSTTLRMINRLTPTDAGTIRIGGEDVTRVPAAELRRRIGYAIQSIGLFPHWTVEANIATVPRLLKWPPARVRDRVTELLELFRLTPELYRGKYPRQLSGGEQQRIGVARALAADPALLLMDEPFGAVDPLTRDELQRELVGIHRATGKTIVFVTHDIEEALRLATRIAVMDRGRIAQLGTPLDIVERPASEFVGDFVGRGGLGLRRLSVRRIAERLRPGETAVGEPVPLDASLRDALSAMTARRTDRLPVADAAGRPVGAIALADLVR
jgi:osmoprotectant transport system ATP-binding protein